MKKLALVATLLGLALPAQARPVEDGTRITLFAGARYVPHHHFELLAEKAGTPVTSDPPVGPEALLSFAYAPDPAVEISLELGAALDRYQFANTTMTMTNVPVVGSLRYMPLDGAWCPYVGGGGGYLLGLVSGAPGGTVDAHAAEFHLLAGISYALSERLLVSLEDRYQFGSGDIIGIGQIQSGGNALMLGLSFVLAPAHDLAPHDRANLQ